MEKSASLRRTGGCFEIWSRASIRFGLGRNHAKGIFNIGKFTFGSVMLIVVGYCWNYRGGIARS